MVPLEEKWEVADEGVVYSRMMSSPVQKSGDVGL